MSQKSPKQKSNDSDVTGPRWYVTTAIPYVNTSRILALRWRLILTDSLARYHRLRGEDVRFLTGTDDNSLKNVRAAEREGIPTSEFIARNARL